MKESVRFGAFADRGLSVVGLLESLSYLLRLGLICVLRYRAIRQHWHRTPVF